MVRVFSEDTQTSVIYSGDFNSCPERHLDAAAPIPTHWRESEVLITETTYCCDTRDSKDAREEKFSSKVSIFGQCEQKLANSPFSRLTYCFSVVPSRLLRP